MREDGDVHLYDACRPYAARIGHTPTSYAYACYACARGVVRLLPIQPSRRSRTTTHLLSYHHSPALDSPSLDPPSLDPPALSQPSYNLSTHAPPPSLPAPRPQHRPRRAIRPLLTHPSSIPLPTFAHTLQALLIPLTFTCTRPPSPPYADPPARTRCSTHRQPACPDRSPLYNTTAYVVDLALCARPLYLHYRSYLPACQRVGQSPR